MRPDRLPCWVYKRPLKKEMYLYLGAEHSLDTVPQPLLERFGTPHLVMHVALHPNRNLA
jgi:uncharacterized protein